MRLATAEELRGLPHGRSARTAGIVTCRQRPGMAKGVVFVTLEDETGYTNVVVWNNLVEKQWRELLNSSLLGVYGEIQREGEVVYLVAHHLVDHSRLLGRLAVGPRIFSKYPPAKPGALDDEPLKAAKGPLTRPENSVSSSI